LLLTLPLGSIGASAQFVEGLSVVAALRFGTVAVLGPGAVTVFPQGTRLADVSMPSSFTLTSQSGAEPLSVVNLSKAPVVTSTGPTASTTVTIGGTLQITGIPGPGTYVGSFPVALAWP
jgi:hypothetical protein